MWRLVLSLLIWAPSFSRASNLKPSPSMDSVELLQLMGLKRLNTSERGILAPCGLTVSSVGIREERSGIFSWEERFVVSSREERRILPFLLSSKWEENDPPFLKFAWRCFTLLTGTGMSTFPISKVGETQCDSMTTLSSSSESYFFSYGLFSASSRDLLLRGISLNKAGLFSGRSQSLSTSLLAEERMSDEAVSGVTLPPTFNLALESIGLNYNN